LDYIDPIRLGGEQAKQYIIGITEEIGKGKIKVIPDVLISNHKYVLRKQRGFIYPKSHNFIGKLSFIL
jgi:hypothetical protein